MVFWTTFGLILIFITTIDAARILGIFGHIGKSHFDVFDPLLKELASRGHEVIVASYFPQKTKLPNYTDIILDSKFYEISSLGGVNVTEIIKTKEFGTDRMILEWGLKSCESIASNSQLQKFVTSKERFDLILSELFANDCYLAYAYKLQVPHIGLVSHVMMPWANDRFGNPDNPAYVPNLFSLMSSNMNFYERLRNTVLVQWRKLLSHYIADVPSQKILSRYFDYLPPLHEIKKSISLAFVNSHFSVHHVRPLVPAVVEVGGLHFSKPTALPHDLEQFMSEAEHGVVYFNMGSMIRAETFPEDKRVAFVKAFSKIPHKVLWKWEGYVPDLPKNVLLRKWFPQIDVLSHKKTVLYIGHGGNLGALEAASAGIPVIVIPMYGDQFNNAKSLEAQGMAEIIQFEDITEESLSDTLRRVLNDRRYIENAQRVSAVFNDRPMSPLDTAVYWTEYVIRHKGAHHLRSASVNLPLYQYLLLDVISFIAAILTVTMYVLYVVTKKLVYPLVSKRKLKSE